MKLATKLIHGGPTIDQQTGAMGVPIYQISTYQQTSVDHFRKYDYARGDNPTREALEETIAVLEGGSRCLAFSSGMAAISTTLMIFSPGDHLVVCDDVYGGAYRVLSTIFTRMGISSTFVDATDLAAIEAAIRPETKGIYLESPSNPLLKITDLRGAVAIAQRHGIITLVDNTFMTPYLQRPLELGCDIVLHSGTKFLNGHSDVICGFAVVKDTELGQRIRYIQNAFGTGFGTAGLLPDPARRQDPQGQDGSESAEHDQDRQLAQVARTGHGAALPRSDRASRLRHPRRSGRWSGGGLLLRTGLLRDHQAPAGGVATGRLRRQPGGGGKHYLLPRPHVARLGSAGGATAQRDHRYPGAALGRLGRPG